MISKLDPEGLIRNSQWKHGEDIEIEETINNVCRDSSQKKKKSCIISLIQGTQSSQTQKQNGDCGRLEGGEWGVSCTMGEVSILQDEKVQEIHSSIQYI